MISPIVRNKTVDVPKSMFIDLQVPNDIRIKIEVAENSMYAAKVMEKHLEDKDKQKNIDARYTLAEHVLITNDKDNSYDCRIIFSGKPRNGDISMMCFYTLCSILQDVGIDYISTETLGDDSIVGMLLKYITDKITEFVERI